MRADRGRRFAPRVVGDGGAHAWTTAGGVRTAGAKAWAAVRCGAAGCVVCSSAVRARRLLRSCRGAAWSMQARVWPRLIVSRVGRKA